METVFASSWNTSLSDRWQRGPSVVATLCLSQICLECVVSHKRHSPVIFGNHVKLLAMKLNSIFNFWTNRTFIQVLRVISSEPYKPTQHGKASSFMRCVTMLGTCLLVVCSGQLPPHGMLFGRKLCNVQVPLGRCSPLGLKVVRGLGLWCRN